MRRVKSRVPRDAALNARVSERHVTPGSAALPRSLPPVKFDRLKDKVERAEAEADALAELRGGPASYDRNDSASAAEDSLDAELAALKKKKSS